MAKKLVSICLFEGHAHCPLFRLIGPDASEASQSPTPSSDRSKGRNRAGDANCNAYEEVYWHPQNRNYLLKQKCLHGHKIPKRAEGGAVGSGRGIVIIIVIVLCPICPGTFLNEISGSTRDCSAPALSIEIEFEMVLCWRRSWPRAAKQLQPYGR